MTEQTEQKAALASLNNFFRKDIEPVGLDQVSSIETKLFQRWVRRSSLGKSQKGKLVRILKPLIDKSAIEGVIFRDATLVEDGSDVDVVILGVPEAFKSRLRDTDVFIIYAESGETDDEDPGGPDNENGDDENQQDTCQYRRCYCANPSNCSCVTATQFNKECPDDECSGDADCGGGSGDSGILEALAAF